MARRMPAARESVPYFQSIRLGPTLPQGSVDITGWTFKLSLTRQLGAASDLTLNMAGTVLADGFRVIDGPGRILTIRISAVALAVIPDTTGSFEMFGDLLATPPGGDRFVVSDLILPVSKGPTA